MKFIFFGTPSPAVHALETLKAHGLVPSLIVTAPDKPAGRGLIMQESPVALFGKENNIPVEKPTALRDGVVATKIKEINPDVGLVFAYGKIIPEDLLSIPRYGTINIHPSLLPKYRGPAPVEGAILDGKEETGISIMLLDSEMDHGPILAQEKMAISSDATTKTLLESLIRRGAEVVVDLLPRILEGNITPKPQDHAAATYTKKITKADGEILLTDDPQILSRKYRAYAGWPRLFFFTERGGKKIRVTITAAKMESNTFIVKMVIPEGRKEMSYEDFLRGDK